jgi:hypothetical protein
MDFSHARRTLRSTVPATLLTLLAVGVPEEGAAQDPDPPLIGDMIQRRIESVEPRSGPPGTTVHVSSVEMPMITPMWIGIGASRIGFEAFQQLMTDMDGTFGMSVEIPPWAQWDRVHNFLAFDLYFRPIALSAPFHVTNEEGMVRRTGRILDAPAGCLGLEDDDGVRYALRGVAPGDFNPGDQVTVEGSIVLEATCGMPFTIDVVEVERVDPG